MPDQDQTVDAALHEQARLDHLALQRIIRRRHDEGIVALGQRLLEGVDEVGVDRLLQGRQDEAHGQRAPRPQGACGAIASIAERVTAASTRSRASRFTVSGALRTRDTVAAEHCARLATSLRRTGGRCKVSTNGAHPTDPGCFDTSAGPAVTRTADPCSEVVPPGRGSRQDGASASKANRHIIYCKLERLSGED